MHNTYLEAEGLTLLSAKNRKMRLKFTEAHQN